MSDHSKDYVAQQQDLFGDDRTRALLDQLLAESRLYKSGRDYKALLDFVVRLREFAPFNAMLLQVQKPGLAYAASAKDWRERFGRGLKDGARPLLILRPFGPVALVYDVVDTEGMPLPDDVFKFIAHGKMSESTIHALAHGLNKHKIDIHWVDAGDSKAGLIRVVRRARRDEDSTHYCIHINRNHAPAVQFTTLAHELGHLALGHLGPDKKLKVPSRGSLTHGQQELEAESVAYIVCGRNGIKAKSQTYLSNFVSENTTAHDLEIYQITRAAGQVENWLELEGRTNRENSHGA
jgi:hypothetical protein